MLATEADDEVAIFVLDVLELETALGAKLSALMISAAYGNGQIYHKR